jgi:hypothetical protein
VTDRESRDGSGIVIATDSDLAWLHNGFDEDAMRASDEKDLERALDAGTSPKHWRPVDVERVG